MLEIDFDHRKAKKTPGSYGNVMSAAAAASLRTIAPAERARGPSTCLPSLLHPRFANTTCACVCVCECVQVDAHVSMSVCEFVCE